MKHEEDEEYDRTAIIHWDQLRIPNACVKCESTEMVQTAEDGSVCVACGSVASDDPLVDYGDGAACANGRGATVTTLGACKRMWGTYERIFHFHERLALLAMAEPPIPAELWDLIEMEFDFGGFERDYPSAERLTKDHVKQICGSIDVPGRLRERFRSTKFKRNPLTSMKRFTEKWISIRRRLGGEAPPLLSPNDVDKLCGWFGQLERPFNLFRHNPGCPRTRKCHKSAAACRHNIPNLNYLLLQLFRKLGKHKLYKPFLPQLRTPAKVRNLDVLCKQMWDYLGWDFKPVYRRKKVAHKSVKKPFVAKRIRKRRGRRSR